jgi:4-hydroxybenzoyl-CoA reductase subunit beta
MLRLNRFSYLSPRSVAEASAMLAQHGDDAMILAGGTDLLVNMKHRVATPSYVVGIRHLSALQDISLTDDGWLTIGAGVTLTQIEGHTLILGRYPALAHAAHLISVPQVRTVGTIGGNICLDVRCNYYNQSYEWRKGIGFCMKKDSPICRVAPGGDRCWAVSSADTVPVLIALRAEVSVFGPQGERRAPIDALYVDDGLEPLMLQPGEIVTAVHLPPPGGWQTVYEKFRIRHSFDFPLVGVASAVHRNEMGAVQDARIVMTALASSPQRAHAAEKQLIGSPLDSPSIQLAGGAIFKQAKPMDNTAGTIFHRKRMARVLAERGLRQLAGLGEPLANTA